MGREGDNLMFGSTLALKGAYDELRAERPHCVEGCFGCELEAYFMLNHWLLEQQRTAPRAGAWILRKNKGSAS